MNNGETFKLKNMQLHNAEIATRLTQFQSELIELLIRYGFEGHASIINHSNGNLAVLYGDAPNRGGLMAEFGHAIEQGLQESGGFTPKFRETGLYTPGTSVQSDNTKH